MVPKISTFLFMIVDKEVTCSYNPLHAVASPDIWQQKIRYISLLGLYKLGKECKRVQFQGKKMSQYPHCTVLKILLQISLRLSANKATRPFAQLCVDQLNLEEECNCQYQDDVANVCQIMVVIFEATGMVITYFI